jgi:hypothetical protein
MDTKTAQKQLIGLITQHLSESIPVTRILTYKPDKNGSVSGKFESLNRVFNFVFSGNDVRYKPAGNMDSALFSEYYLQRFDAAPATPRGTRALPKCTSKSYSCKGAKGVACITLTKGCKLETDAIGKERLNKIKGLSSSLAGEIVKGSPSNPETMAKFGDFDKANKIGSNIISRRKELAEKKKTERSKIDLDPYLNNSKKKKEKAIDLDEIIDGKKAVATKSKKKAQPKIDLESFLDDDKPDSKNTKTTQPVNKESLVKNWSKKFEAFEKGDKDRASVDSEEKDEKGTPLLQAYLRKGSYFVNGKTYPKVNQLASIEVSEGLRGQGIFSSVIKEIEKRHPDRPIVIEGVSDGSIALAKKNGFEEDTHSSGNWVKMPKK